MEDGSKSVFYYIQKLLQSIPKVQRPKKAWGETFRYIISMHYMLVTIVCVLDGCCVIFITLSLDMHNHLSLRCMLIFGIHVTMSLVDILSIIFVIV